MEEESFPRGGVVKQEKANKKLKAAPKDKDLFEERENVETKKEAKKKWKEKKKKTVEEKKKKTIKGTVSGQGSQPQPEHLGKMIHPGMLVYGYVKDVGTYDLKMALPNGLIGTVAITNISVAYTEMIQQFAAKTQEEQEEIGESMVTLSDLFSVGELLPCKVVECDQTGCRKNIKLSLNPVDVNESLTSASIRNGMYLYGSIMSEEDHGYTLDIGVKGVQAFLQNKEAKEYIVSHNEGKALRTGQCLMCGVPLKKDKAALDQSRVLNVTVDPDKLKNMELKGSHDVPFSSLIPGMKVKVTVDKVDNEGLLVSFLKFKGSIHISHLPKALVNYSENEELTATILYIHPMSKAVALSCLPYIVNYCGVAGNQFGDLNFGMLVDEATVKKINKKGKKKGVYFKLADKITGFSSVRNLSDSFDEANWDKDFPKGSTHRCRVLGFFPMEGLVNITLKQSILEKKYMNVSDINPGDLIQCHVQKLHDKGMSVTVAKGITGFVPSYHLADITLKHPEKKFTKGDKLKCRVLTVDKEKKTVTLTHKKSLVTTRYPVVTDYSQLKSGMMVEGYIYCIKDCGVFVRFFNDVQGLAPRSLLSSEPIPILEKVFYRGQVVRCKVVSVVPEKRKLKLTFMLEGQKEFGKREVDVPEDYELGKIVQCKIVKKHDKSLDVMVLPSEKQAFLPKMHLSDSPEVCEALMKFYKIGDVIDEVMYLHKHSAILLTKKNSLLAASREETLVKGFQDLELGKMLPGSVKNIANYGVFIQFPGGLSGLVPKQYLADKPKTNPQIYKEDETVIAKVIEMDKEKERFLASLRMLDCYHGDTDIGICILESYLQERQQIKNMLSDQDIKKIDVGDIHHGSVTQLNELGAICNLDNGVKAIATKDHLEGVKVSEGSEFDCIILHVDVINNCVEVTLDKHLVTAIRKRQSKTGTANQAQVGQEVKSKVLLVKEDCILISLKGHAVGQLAYLPSKRHFNDILERHQYGVGQENPVIIKSIDSNDKIIASLKIHEDKVKEEAESLISHIPKHSLQVGDIKTAVVKKILPDQIHIKIGNTPGRVHATEIHDRIENGSLPAQNIKVNSKVKVRIIGFKDTKSWKQLPISHPNLKRSFPECTIRPSMLSMKELPANFNYLSNNLKVGEEVVAYPYDLHGNCLWTHVRQAVQGRVSVLNLTDEEHYFSAPAQQFVPGRGYNGRVIKVLGDSKVELTFVEQEAKVGVSTVTKGVITSIRPDAGLMLQLADDVRGRAGLTDLCDNYVDFPTSQFRVGQLVHCFVLSLDKEKTAEVSLRKSRLEGEKAVDNPDIQSLSDLSPGQILRGFVVKHYPQGLQVRVGHEVDAWVKRGFLSDKGTVTDTKPLFKIGQVVTVKLVSIGKENKTGLWSMLEKDTGVALDIPDSLVTKRPRTDSESSTSAKKNRRKRSLSASSVEQEEPSSPKRTKSSKKSNETKSLSEKKSVIKKDKKRVSRPSESDSGAKSDESISEPQKKSVIKKGKKNKHDMSETNLENSESEGISVTTKHKKNKEKSSSDNLRKKGDEKDKPKKRKNSGETYKSAKIKKTSVAGEDSDMDADQTVKVSDSLSLPHLDLSEGFSWGSDFQLPTGSSGPGEISSDDSDSEEIKKPVKKSREELRREKQEEEKRLYEYERRQLEGEIIPETADDFDRLVLQSPDSSLVWLRYMAFHLETSEIDKARAVAERALKTIVFREEQEKLNVWVAYLNLENMYGSNDSLQKVLARAIQQNDAKTVYLQMVNIYCKSDKTEEAEHVYNILVKKHSLDKDIWVKFGQFYFQNNRLESARKLLQRCLKVIENKHHVETIAKFAQMEFKFGEPERGKTMFENILGTYPKRTDLWSVYIDMVTKLQEFDNTRALYNRVTGLKFSARKMKFFFKKYLEFEERHGTEALVAEVKQKALDYVETQGYVED